jgi:hypothetical protein
MPPDFVDAIGRFQYVNDEKGKNRRVATRLRRKAKGKRQKYRFASFAKLLAQKTRS